MRKAIILNPKDNVATAVKSLVQDEKITLGVVEPQIILSILQNIPYGHKFAIKNINKGETIIKYGEEIGVAMEDISSGAYVHIHNVESQRGRGDK